MIKHYIKLLRQIKSVFLFINSKRAYYLPGVILFFILFLASTLMNFGFTYMGNTSGRIVDMLFQFYKAVISVQIIKIIIAYLAAGAVISTAIHSAVVECRKRYNISDIPVTIITASGTFLFSFFYVSKKFISNPQLYVENFADHSAIFRKYLYFLTDNVNPLFFDSIIYLFIIITISLILISINWNRLSAKVRSLFEKNSAVKIILLAVLFLLWLLYRHDVIFYNNEKDRPNILILSSDALRPDHMSFNGYNKITTPNIDALAKESLQIKIVFKSLPRTFTAWVSILSSKYPLTHGINHMFPRTRERNLEFNTVVKYLNNAGYYSAVISDFAGDIFPRIDLGFKKTIAPDMNTVILIKQIMLEKQTFLLPFINNKAGLFFFPEMRDMAKLSFPRLLTEETCDEIGSLRGKPFFITVFYSITHFPFSPPYPYYKKFADRGYKGPYKYFKDRKVNLDAAGDSSEKIDNKDEEQVNALYDGCMNLFDHEAGIVIQYLKKHHLLDNTIIVVTSDHGENLYEKDFGMGHGEHLKGKNSLEVPLIIYSSRLKSKGRVLEAASSSVDIMPTVLDIAGIPIPDSFEGTSIIKRNNKKQSLLNSRVDAYCETGMWFDNDKTSPYFFHHKRIDYPDISGVSEIDFDYKDEVVISQKYQNIVNGAKYRAIFSGNYKLIYIPLTHGPVFELYNYVDDPDNIHDLSKSRRDILETMKNKFYGFVNEKSAGNFLIKDGLLFPAFTEPVF